jgi:hypothetical protein
MLIDSYKPWSKLIKRSIMLYNLSRGVNPQFLKTLKDYSKRKIAMNCPLFYKLRYKLLKTSQTCETL